MPNVKNNESTNGQPGIIVSKTPLNASASEISHNSQSKNSNLNSQINSDESSQRQQNQNSNILSTDTAKETGLNATANVIRDQSLHPANQKAAHNLVDRMYWSREENVDRTVSVDDKGSLEDL